MSIELKNKLDQYVRDGLINTSKKDELTIYNYSQEVQFEKKWDKYTLMARGLILHDDGTIIARPWPKFFNLGERPETFVENLPKESYEVSDKLDGSLGILYNYNGYKIATRGSFESDQAKHAQKILTFQYNYIDFDRYSDHTFLFEIIYPENRIVVNYKDTDDLFLIGAVHKETGVEMRYTDVQLVAREFKLKTIETYQKSIDEIIEDSKTAKENKEGYVIRFESGLRVKIKTEEYCRLHKILTGFNIKHIWEMLKNGDDRNRVLENVPDEFHKWFEEEESKLHVSYLKIKEESQKILNNCPGFLERKDIALYFKENGGNLISILFAMLDRKDYSEIIWKMIKPKLEDVTLNVFKS